MDHERLILLAAGVWGDALKRYHALPEGYERDSFGAECDASYAVLKETVRAALATQPPSPQPEQAKENDE